MGKRYSYDAEEPSKGALRQRIVCVLKCVRARLGSAGGWFGSQ
jgi:hypothetical protein